MSYYSEMDDIQALEDEVGFVRRRKPKSKSVSICADCPKEGECYMNNGRRQACNHKHIFTQDQGNITLATDAKETRSGYVSFDCVVILR